MKAKRLAALAAAAAMFLTGCSLFESDSQANSFASLWESEQKQSSKAAAIPEVSQEDISLLSDSTRYFYDRITSQRMKTAVIVLYKGLKAHDEQISFQGLEITEDEIRDLFDLLLCCEPELGWVDYHYEINTNDSDHVENAYFRYDLSPEKEAEAISKMNDAISLIVAGTEGYDDFQKAVYFHDIIVSSCEYDKNSRNAWSAYGALVDNRAVCEGYSKAMIALCSAAGMTCLPVGGSSTDESGTELHMWNKLLIDGKWYNVDVTMDDPVHDEEEQAEDQGKYDFIHHEYFAVTDEMLSRDHTASETGLIKYPAAVSQDDNFYIRCGLYIDDPGQTDSILYYAASTALEQGESIFQLAFADSGLYDDFYSVQLKGEQIFTVLQQLSDNGFEIDNSSYEYIPNSEQSIMTIILHPQN